MKVLSKTDFLQAKPALRFVAIPELDEDAGVYVRVMSAVARDRFEKFMADAKETRSKRAYFASLVACDADGAPIFSEEDVRELGEKDYRSLNRIMADGIELNAMGKEQQDALKKD